ncbi:hypothetical protein [Candidatus Fokinia crypta]|uniref:Uncharacterized protein n=1 Tax=Candidatus Fokinia crypta TaxID=1920990 RepID=A0ABZ0UQ80_9RICK|nr:hypothetical protein [Candidatus Fokinia cryptica]WPX97822.1 hypothetical protein Fokcrypt_00342 [Candidatus Fokinia cryptica]
MHSVLNFLHIVPSFLILGLFLVISLRSLWRKFINSKLGYESEASFLMGSLMLSAVGIVAGSFVHHGHEHALGLLDPCFIYAAASVIVSITYRKVLAKKIA